MPRILLTTVCRPLRRSGDGPSLGADVMKGQLCINQGAFRTSGVGLAYGLEYIAANLRSPAVVLHWPSRAELIRELRASGPFDMVGLTFTFQLLPRMVETVRVIREHAPAARVVLGGFGVAAPEAARHADLVCEGDGIAYMRRLVGERAGEPVEHPVIVYENRLLSLPVRAGRKLVVCTGLGCAVGCDFCASSAKFGRSYVPFVEDGRELFRVMERLSGLTGIDEFQLLDENFLVQAARARLLADLCDERKRFFEFFTFSSVAALSSFSADELCRIGVSAVWIGLEGKQAGYDKLHGDRLGQLVRRLRHHGILVCGSMIIGFDYQTPEVIQTELAEILDAGPTYLQCLIYGPAPGTPLHQRLADQGRFARGGPGRGVPFGRCDGFELTFSHPTISAGDMARLQRECYDRDLDRGGFSIFRAIETWLEGYENLRAAPEPFLRARARIYERKLRASRVLMDIGIRHAPNPSVRQRMVALRRRLVEEFGPLDGRERALASVVLPAAARWTAFSLAHGLFQEPALVRRRYRC